MPVRVDSSTRKPLIAIPLTGSVRSRAVCYKRDERGASFALGGSDVACTVYPANSRGIAATCCELIVDMRR